MADLAVGFTGTRTGMTSHQQATLVAVLYRLWEPGATFHHGDCVGADAQAHDVALGLGYEVHAYPSNLPGQRAFRPGAAVTHEPAPPLARNRWVVDACDVLVAAPSTLEERLRSGTWSTIRYAHQRGKAVHVLEPTETAHA